MRVLKKFTLLTAHDDSGNELIDDDGNLAIGGMEFGFENSKSVVVSFPDDPSPEEITTAITDQMALVNIIKADNVVVEEYDSSWLDWVMDQVKIDPNAIEAVEEMEEPGAELTADVTGKGEEIVETLADNSPVSGTRKPKAVRNRRKGPGCKPRTEVAGWAAGRVLSTTKRHRSNGWGACYYRVLCEDDGSYTLTQFKGKRSDIAEGDHWVSASEMFRALCGWDHEALTAKAGKWKQGSRMTIARYFGLNKS